MTHLTRWAPQPVIPAPVTPGMPPEEELLGLMLKEMQPEPEPEPEPKPKRKTKAGFNTNLSLTAPEVLALFCGDKEMTAADIVTKLGGDPARDDLKAKARGVASGLVKRGALTTSIVCDVKVYRLNGAPVPERRVSTFNSLRNALEGQGWRTAAEVAEDLGVAKRTVADNLLVLLRREEVKRKGGVGPKEFKYFWVGGKGGE